jgi:hypothetical protein
VKANTALRCAHNMVSSGDCMCELWISTYSQQPPKRRAAAKVNIAPKRPSKLAKQHGLTADQEAEIREAFGLFAIQHPEHEDSKEGVLRKDDVRRCLMYASDFQPTKRYC